MIVEFSVHPSFDFLTKIADVLNVQLQNNTLILPPKLGEGYIKKVEIDQQIKLVMHHYKLNQELRLKRISATEKNDLISIVLNSQEIPSQESTVKKAVIRDLTNNLSSIQVASSSMETESIFHKNSEVFFAVIGISSTSLKSLLRLPENDKMYKIIFGEQPFFFHERITPNIYKLIKQLVDIREDHVLEHLFYKAKITELIYLTFSKILKRSEDSHGPINNRELEKLYEIRAMLIENVNTPPRLPDLAKYAAMSETKMKQLFKQVFGDSVYNYYQTLRMEQAAILLRQSENSVSEVGYQLGFSNLSHFSRIFNRHYGMTPKKFSSAVLD